MPSKGALAPFGPAPFSVDLARLPLVLTSGSTSKALDVLDVDSICRLADARFVSRCDTLLNRCDSKPGPHAVAQRWRINGVGDCSPCMSTRVPVHLLFAWLVALFMRGVAAASQVGAAAEQQGSCC
jgi:hypothetical protein